MSSIIQGQLFWRPRLHLVCAAVLLASCGPGPHLAIEICSDLVVPEDLDAVRLLATHSGDEESLGGFLDLLDPDRRDDDPCPKIVHHFPVDFMLVEGRGDMLLTAEGLAEGVVKVTGHGRASFPDQGGERVVLSLERACIGVTCARGQTCQGGVCDPIPWGDASVCPEPAPPVPMEERCPEPEEEEEADEEEGG